MAMFATPPATFGQPAGKVTFRLLGQFKVRTRNTFLISANARSK